MRISPFETNVSLMDDISFNTIVDGIILVKKAKSQKKHDILL